MRRAIGVAAAVALVAGLVAGLVLSTTAAGPTRDRMIGPADPAEPISFTLVLRRGAPAALQRYLATLASPPATAGPDAAPTLGAGAFGRRFGLPLGRIDALRRALTASGLEITRTYPQRTALRVRGPAADVEQLLAVRIAEFTGPAGRYHAPLGLPTIPAAWRYAVRAVAGLSDRPSLVSFHHLGEVPAGGLTPAVAASAYDALPLLRTGVRGQGQTVAVVSFATFRDSDIAAFDQRFGIDSPPVQHVSVGGGTSTRDLEANLDVEVIRGLAPGATILNYEAPNGRASIGDVIDRIVADGRARIISISWGFCAGAGLQAERDRDQASIDAAIAHGITIFAASGDAGAYDCQRQDATNLTASVDWPAESPHVIGVGGTRLFLTRAGGYARETGWQDVLSGVGSGGGLSAIFRRSAFQTGPGVENPQTTGARQVPDVAGPADPDTGFTVVASDKTGQLNRYQIGGTSAAAPFWAATAALVAGFAVRSNAGRLGFMGPMLYAIAAAPRPSPAFHDVTRGGNRRFVAAPGWDFVTGLGSPDINGLARDAVAYLRAR